jgi:6-phosphogluconolactonase (cycloisomerase 2 family)
MKTKFRVLVALAAVVVGAMWLTGCDHYTCSKGATFGASSCTASGNGLGSGGNNSTQTAFVFFEDTGAGQIAAEGLNVGNTGNFAPVSGFVVPQLPQTLQNNGAAFGGMVIVSKKYLYISYSANTGAGPNEIAGYSINPASGALTLIGTSIPLGGAPFLPALAADPAGNFVFVSMGTEIGVYAVNPNTGALTSVGTAPTLSDPTQMTTDGVGKFLYALEGNSVAAFSYNTSGTLTSVPNSPFTFTNNGSQIALNQISGEKSGNFLLGITAEDDPGGGFVDDNVYVLAISQTTNAGALTLNNAFNTGASPIFLAVSPAAEFVYTFNETFVSQQQTAVNPMQGYSIGSTGQLTLVTGSSQIFATRGMLDQSGTFIFAYVVDSNSLQLSTTPLAVGSDGSVSTTNFGNAGALGPFVVTDEP